MEETSHDLTEEELDALLTLAAQTADEMFKDPVRIAELERRTAAALKEMHQRHLEQDRKAAAFWNRLDVRLQMRNCLTPIY